MPNRLFHWWDPFASEPGSREDGGGRIRRGRGSPALLGFYLVLAALLAVTLVVTVRFEQHPMVERFGPNVATEILSIIVTLAVVQRLLERQERARKLRAAVGALRKGRAGLARLLELWATLVKGSLDPRRTEYPRSVHQLFAPYYTEELASLDPTLRRGTDPETPSWLGHVVHQMAATERSLRELILTYGATLEADYLEALDEIVDDPFMALMRELASREHLSPEEWRLRINRSRGHQEAHFVRLLHAVELHNELARETARFRSRHLAPRAQHLTLELSTDRDLAVETDLPPGWWSHAPAVGALRVPGGREAARPQGAAERRPAMPGSP